MPSANPTVRVIVDPVTESHIIEMARQESRSLNNMAAKLIREAPHERLHARARDTLVATISGEQP
jgi:hypothetical protein